MQAGARTYPALFPKQHIEKPGLESELAVQPMYDAPYYRGSDKLRGIVALITSGDSGIGRTVAVLYAREGTDVAITYLNEYDDAETTKRAVEAEGAISHCRRRGGAQEPDGRHFGLISGLGTPCW
jgi:hypothetical protein